MKPKVILSLLLIGLHSFIFGQTNEKRVLGAHCKTCPSNAQSKTLNDTAGIATSYTASACGLNFTQSSIRLDQRTFSLPNPAGVAQPASFTIAGIPGCASILKAFLYIGLVGTGGSFTTTLTNSANTTSVYPMSMIGSDGDICWNTNGTFSYRADVTALVTGNGNYALSGVPTSTVSGINDAEGATLFVIYAEGGQSYTGNIVVADGCQIDLSDPFKGSSISGFSVCGTPSVTTGFMILADLQQIANTDIWFNMPFANPANYTTNDTLDNVWNFISQPAAPVVAGQTSANLGFWNQGDCVAMMMAGLYYRSSCPTCVPMSNINMTASGATVCAGQVATFNAAGATTYSWTGPGGFSSVASSPTIATTASTSPGTYTVVGTSSGTCSGTSTLQVNLSVLPLPPVSVAATHTIICKGQSSMLMAGGTPPFTWFPPSIGTGTSVVVSPTLTSTYTLQANSTCDNRVMITVVVSACTGIQGLAPQSTSVLIYPNPTNGNFTVNSDTELHITIVNNLGQTIKTIYLNEQNNYTVSVTGLSEGIYYLVSQDKEKSLKQKLIVSKP